MALEYTSFRDEAVQLLEQLTAPSWTDFNEHDPGITLLEAVCYALTDLSYRTGFDLPDILCREGEDTYASLFPPERIFPSSPVTLADLRKVVLDVPGVRHAWIEEVTVSDVAMGVSNGLTGGTELALDQSTGLYPRGLLRVLIEQSRTFKQGSDELVREVAKRLHEARGLCLDVASIDVAPFQEIQVHATVEIAPAGDAELIYSAILRKTDSYFSPVVSFQSLEQQLADGKSLEDMFLGPRLTQGFLEDDQLEQIRRKTQLRTSDLVREIMDVDGVRMVDFIAFSVGDKPLEPWVLELDPNAVPLFRPRVSEITLQIRQVPLKLDEERLIAAFDQASTPFFQNVTAPWANRVPLPAGRDRHIGVYHSVMYDLPRLYGVGEAGLPADASDSRQAQAKQLQAYLLLFDQLMANGFAQLAYTRELLGFESHASATYVAGTVDAPVDDSIWCVADPAIRQQRLQRIAENGTAAGSDSPAQWPRKNRFLDHLLARVGETLPDVTQYRSDARRDDERLARDKAEFLRAYPFLSGARGCGADVTVSGSDGQPSALEHRLRLKLRLKEGEQLFLVEHILLRPIQTDLARTVPWMADPISDDPFSLRLTVAFQVTDATLVDKVYRQYVEQVVREAVPAHLVLGLLWLSETPGLEFGAAFQTWRQSQADLRTANVQRRLGKMPEPGAEQHLSLRFRAARDRMIDLLGLGQTYPIRDLILTVTQGQMVSPGKPANIEIADSQWGVAYQLCDEQGVAIVGDGTVTVGNGGTVALTTPAMEYDRIFSIKATKTFGNQERTAMLSQTVLVKVGLNPELPIWVEGSQWLEPTRTTPADAHLFNYGDHVTVVVLDSQEDVTYRLVDSEGKELSVAPNTGNLASIPLELASLNADVDIFVQASRADRQALLNTVLRLRVRADTSIAVALEQPVVDFRTGTTLTVSPLEPTVAYAAFVHPIADSEFIRLDPAPEDVSVQGAGSVGLRVRMPEFSLPNPSPGRYAALGDPQKANARSKKLKFNIAELEPDSLVVIRAEKPHPTADGRTVSSYAQIQQAAVVLTRPDPGVPLKFEALEDQGVLTNPIVVTGGQPGVFYHFRVDKADADLGPPVYFHQRDRVDPRRNKGIDQLAVEVDFVLPPDRTPVAADVATAAPESPQLVTVSPLHVDDVVTVRAVKAQTGVEQTFTRTVRDLLAGSVTPASPG